MPTYADAYVLETESARKHSRFWGGVGGRLARGLPGAPQELFVETALRLLGFLVILGCEGPRMSTEFAPNWPFIGVMSLTMSPS